MGPSNPTTIDPGSPPSAATSPGIDRWLPRHLAQRLLLAVCLPLSLAALAALVIFGGLRETIAAQAELQRVDQVFEAISDLRLRFLIAQTTARDFALSGDENLLPSFEGALGAREQTVADLRRLFSGDDAQGARLDAAEEVFARWRREVAEPTIVGLREVPPQHIAAVVDARAALLDLAAAARSGADGPNAAVAHFRAMAGTAVATTRRSALRLAWAEALDRANRLEAASGPWTSRLEADLPDLIAATAAASALSLQAHRSAIRPTVDGTARGLADRMFALEDEMLAVARVRVSAAAAHVVWIRRLAIAVAVPSLALAITLGLFAALSLARRLLVPIRSITRASEAIEAGDLSARAVALTGDEVGRLARRFNGMAERLERRDREISSLHDLSQLLQTAGDADEAFEIFERLTPVLLPKGSGSIHLISASRVELELRARFGPGREVEAALASPSDCWALRKGQSHFVASADRQIICAHLGGRDGMREPSACLPLVAQNETLGLLHVSFPSAALGHDSIEARRSELEAIANALGLALGNLALREKLKAQSVRDPLTSLYNRRFLEEALPREIDRCRRRTLPLVLVMADLDHFKRLNDTWGHEAGDVAIQRFAETLRRNFRQEDILCRYGGEEFCLVLPECTVDDARRRCEQVLAQMREATIQLGRDLVGPVTVSLGLVGFPVDAATAESLLRAADNALYRAKQGGRDRLVRFQAKSEAA